jgi:purine-nucleoside phosphorylase
MFDQICEASDFLVSKGISNPDIAIIFGTGLGNLFVREMTDIVEIDYSVIPHFRV